MTAVTGEAIGSRAVAREPMGPGLLLTSIAVALALGVNALLPSVSSLVVAVVLGALLANLGAVRSTLQPGLTFASRRLLRAGIVLLGLQLSAGDVVGLGGAGIAVVVLTVAATFMGTLGIGRLLGLGRDLTVLVASGFSICGAAAVAAVQGVTRADEDDVALAIALVTVYGTVAMVTLPLLAVPLLLTAAQYGAWAGAGVHEVSQVVAAGSAVGPAALAVAVVVKLSRVVLLAPLVLVLGMVQRRSAGNVAQVHPPLVPLFVIGFLAAVVLRSTGVLPEAVLGVAAVSEQIALTGALFALGTGVRLRALLGTGRQALALGAGSTLLAGGVSLAAAVVLL
jgi:uncharacterized integral membrane protein (TIGR00698 family)